MHDGSFIADLLVQERLPAEDAQGRGNRPRRRVHGHHEGDHELTIVPVPTLRVGTHVWTLRVPSLQFTYRDAERRGLRSHAERGTEERIMSAEDQFTPRTDNITPKPTPNGAITKPPAGLPPVSPPSGKLMLQLFLVPGLIVAFLVVAWLVGGWLFGVSYSKDDVPQKPQ